MSVDCGFIKENYWFRYRAAAIIVEDGCVLLAGNDVDDYLYSVGGAVHAFEDAEDAAVREVLEETGVRYEVDRLAFIHENFFRGSGSLPEGTYCHEIAFYFLMKPRGSREMDSHSVTSGGVPEHMHWIPLDELENHRHFPTFLGEELRDLKPGIKHIVTRE